MKKLQLVAAASLLAFCTTSATAGVIQKRRRHQRARIQQGVESGNLTGKEAARLNAEQNAIRAERGKAMADGKITGSERAEIRQDQNQASREIRRKKHNSHVQQ